MTARTIFGFAAFGLAATLILPASTHAEQDRISASEKGSLLIYSKVVVRETMDGSVLWDTFLTMTNDYNEDVKVQLYMVNGDYWTNVDTEITLTANQPIFWSVRTGQPAGGGVGSGNVSPFPSAGPHVEINGERVWQGFVLGWAVDSENEPIRWNHLAGNAMVVVYDGRFAFEYNAWASQVSDAVAHGARVSQESGTLNMNGVEYAQPYDQLLLNFYAPNAVLLSGQNIGVLVLDSFLTLHLVDADLRQDGFPRQTKADIDIWNMNETKFSNTRRCIACWDSTLLRDYVEGAIIGVDPPNNFLLANLQTRAGKARIEGNASTDCDVPGFLSESLPLLGVKATGLRPVGVVIRGGNDISVDVSAVASNLVGMGVQDATIQYDALSGSPPEQANEESRRPVGTDVPRRVR